VEWGGALAPPSLDLPHIPSPRPHLLRYVASRGTQLLCIQRAHGTTATQLTFSETERVELIQFSTASAHGVCIALRML